MRCAGALWSSCLLAVAAPLAVGTVHAQTDTAGIRLVGPYTTNRPMLAVRPFAAGTADALAADSIAHILRRDLRYSGRYELFDAVPAALHNGDIDYAAWNATGTVYLVTGTVVAAETGLLLELMVHDVVYARRLRQRLVQLPAMDDPGFRMGVHAVADAIVKWTLDEPGHAASRIAAVRRNADGGFELVVADADGHGLRRAVASSGRIYSPVWSPDGRRILYTVSDDDNARWLLREYEIATGEVRTIGLPADVAMVGTPAWTPRPGRVLLAVWRGRGQQIMEYDIARGCCLRPLTGREGFLEGYPTLAPDGERIAFVSDHLQRGRPHVFVMSVTGGTPVRLTRHVPELGHYYTSTAWSPTGSRIAFHGHWNAQGSFHLMIADADRPGEPIELLTAGGSNEDPSWAPDGRHLTYVSTGDGPAGVYVIDTVTRERRLVVEGARLRTPDWSPLLLRLEDAGR